MYNVNTAEIEKVDRPYALRKLPCYRTFQKHAYSEVQNLTRIAFSLPFIAVTTTIEEPFVTETNKTNRNLPITTRYVTFEPGRSPKMIDGSEKCGAKVIGTFSEVFGSLTKGKKFVSNIL